MSTRTRKRSAMILCVMFILVTWFSLFYVAKEENHICTGEDCPICACVRQVEQTIKNLGTGADLPDGTFVIFTCILAAHAWDLCQIPAMSLIVVFRTLVVLETGVLLAAVCFLKLIPHSLVSRKIRLND